MVKDGRNYSIIWLLQKLPDFFKDQSKKGWLQKVPPLITFNGLLK
jgi:hypothetical protein